MSRTPRCICSNMGMVTFLGRARTNKKAIWVGDVDAAATIIQSPWFGPCLLVDFLCTNQEAHQAEKKRREAMHSVLENMSLRQQSDLLAFTFTRAVILGDILAQKPKVYYQIANDIVITWSKGPAGPFQHNTKVVAVAEINKKIGKHVIFGLVLAN